ncbi:BREX system ATP-binding protein BrxD [Solirubrobacter taibaiensis]|nr:BREX system ATP-binding protein BrxD [Solirubrobacter taibaiensis]
MTAPMPSARRREEIVAALLRGSVPERGLETFAVGLERLAPAVEKELHDVAAGGAHFKAIRGDYGTGKTFFARWLTERAKAEGFATSEVQISETETPLHRLETVYRRLVERLSTADVSQGALRTVLERWGFALEEDVLATGEVSEHDEAALAVRVDRLMEGRLAEVSRSAPLFATALRAHRAALAAGDKAQADGVLAWIGAQPNVPAAVKRKAGFKGEIDHFGALSFLQGLLVVLRDAGHSGLVLVLDEIETLQRVRSDVREKSLNALRQLIDEVYGGRFPGLYLVITGTPAFFDGPQGAQRLAPLAQRLATDFAGDPRFDNPRAVQLRLPAFDFDRLVSVGMRVRDIYVEGRPAEERLRSLVDDAYVRGLADAVAGVLGGRVGIAPRIYLKKLVDVLDRVDQFPDFDPRRDYALAVGDGELTLEERESRTPPTADDIELDV